MAANSWGMAGDACPGPGEIAVPRVRGWPLSLEHLDKDFHSLVGPGRRRRPLWVLCSGACIPVLAGGLAPIPSSLTSNLLSLVPSSLTSLSSSLGFLRLDFPPCLSKVFRRVVVVFFLPLFVFYYLLV